MTFYRFYCTLVFVSLFFAYSGAQTTAKPFIKISGEVTKPLTLTMDDLRKMKHTDATQKDKQGVQQTYTGVYVPDMLELAGATMGKQLSGKNLAKYILVKCADGYSVLFSLAELDSSFTDRKIILAYESEGKPLPTAQGPLKLVVPGEKKPARSCRQVNEIVVGFVKE